MAITQSQLDRLNHRFGEAVGFNPHGQPNFKWVRTEQMVRYVDYSHGRPVQHESGLFLFSKQYVPRPWAERYGKCWILAKWRHYSESEWFTATKGALPFPAMGDWEPVENIRLGPEYKEHEPDPNEESTTDAITAIKMHRERLAANSDLNVVQQQLMQEADDEHRKVVAAQKNRIGDELEDLTPAFGKLPGSHDGSTEFMSGR